MSDKVHRPIKKVPSSRKLELSHDATPFETMHYYAKVFRDPPNADLILKGIDSAGTVRTDSVPGARKHTYPYLLYCHPCLNMLETGAATRKERGVFRLLQFNMTCTNSENFLRATLFLHSNLRDRARPDDDHHFFSYGKDADGFRGLAADLARAEPTLKGVTGGALFSFYERLIIERKNLSDFVCSSGSAHDMWTDTHMSELAKELVTVDNLIRERDFRLTVDLERFATQKREGAHPMKPYTASSSVKSSSPTPIAIPVNMADGDVGQVITTSNSIYPRTRSSSVVKVPSHLARSTPDSLFQTRKSMRHCYHLVELTKWVRPMDLISKFNWTWSKLIKGLHLHLPTAFPTAFLPLVQAHPESHEGQNGLLYQLKIMCYGIVNLKLHYRILSEF